MARAGAIAIHTTIFGFSTAPCKGLLLSHYTVLPSTYGGLGESVVIFRTVVSKNVEVFYLKRSYT